MPESDPKTQTMLQAFANENARIPVAISYAENRNYVDKDLRAEVLETGETKVYQVVNFIALDPNKYKDKETQYLDTEGNWQDVDFFQVAVHEMFGHVLSFNRDEDQAVELSNQHIDHLMNNPEYKKDIQEIYGDVKKKFGYEIFRIRDGENWEYPITGNVLSDDPASLKENILNVGESLAIDSEISEKVAKFFEKTLKYNQDKDFTREEIENVRNMITEINDELGRDAFKEVQLSDDQDLVEGKFYSMNPLNPGGMEFKLEDGNVSMDISGKKGEGTIKK